MSATVQKDLEPIKIGDTETKTATFKKNGSAVDISNETWWLTIKDDLSKDDSEALVQVKNEPGEHSDPTNGETTFKINPSDTKDLEEQQAKYDIQRKNENGDIKTYLEGNIAITNEVTKDE